MLCLLCPCYDPEYEKLVSTDSCEYKHELSRYAFWDDVWIDVYKRWAPRETHVVSPIACAANGPLMIYYCRLLKHVFKWYSNPNLATVISVNTHNALWEKIWIDVLNNKAGT